MVVKVVFCCGGVFGFCCGEVVVGWLFIVLVIVIFGVFFFIFVLMVFWVSVLDWVGCGSFLFGFVFFVGVDNFVVVFGDGGFVMKDFGIVLCNNVWYVLFVVLL